MLNVIAGPLGDTMEKGAEDVSPYKLAWHSSPDFPL
jgi:hypothetical protein